MLTITERIPSKLDLVPALISRLIDKIHPMVSEKDIFNIKLSLEESIVNAIKHGNKLNPALSVEVSIEATRDTIKIKVKDQGDGFDADKVPNPTHVDNLTKTSGRGIFLIKNLMDKVEFFDCGRGIEMVKFIKS